MIKGSLLLSAPLLGIFRRKKLSSVLNLTVLGDKQGFNIKFKFYNPKKAHPCVISRLMSYRTQKSINRSDLYASLRKKGINR